MNSRIERGPAGRNPRTPDPGVASRTLSSDETLSDDETLSSDDESAELDPSNGRSDTIPLSYEVETDAVGGETRADVPDAVDTSALADTRVFRGDTHASVDARGPTDTLALADARVPSADTRPAAAEEALPSADAREGLEPLFRADQTADYHERWTAVQSNFVDDPRNAVRQGDELVAQVMQSLAESFAAERDKLEGQLDRTGEASTEMLRVALRRYRSFFERLLSL